MQREWKADHRFITQHSKRENKKSKAPERIGTNCSRLIVQDLYTEIALANTIFPSDPVSKQLPLPRTFAQALITSAEPAQVKERILANKVVSDQGSTETPTGTKHDGRGVAGAHNREQPDACNIPPPK